MPKRLFQLARWFGSVLDQPAAIWWAAGKALPHPSMVREIDCRLDHSDDLSPPARHFWQCYLDAADAQANDTHNLRQYEVVKRIKKEGWTKGVLRELEHAFAPSFGISRARPGLPIPPAGSWENLNLINLAEIKVNVSRWADGINPPPAMLPRVIALVRHSLERMAELLEESTTVLWRTPTLHPTGDRGESFAAERQESYFLRFKDLFDGLVAHDVMAARHEVENWDSNDPVFFAKLYLYAATRPGVIEPNKFAQCILAMPDDVWWSNDMTRELLFALRSQWKGMSSRKRSVIEDRIIRGHPIYDEESDADHNRVRATQAASWLRWLELNNCNLSRVTLKKLPALKSADPRWSDSWALCADDSPDPRSDFIERVTESQSLENAPISDVMALATELSKDDIRQFREYRPFDGLVAKNPFVALSALRLVARGDDYPMRFWHSLVDNWPKEVDDRLVLLLAQTLARLPNQAFVDLRYGIARWTQKFMAVVICRRRKAGLAAFDVIAARYLASDPTTLKSAVGTVRAWGIEQEKSEFSVMKSINTPGGNLARLMLGQLGKRSRQSSMPNWIGSRLERLLLLPGDGSGHVACVIAQKFGWLNYWFPDWTTKLIPLFSPEHPLAEAMWHGIAAAPNFIGNIAGRRISGFLATILAGEAQWDIDSDARRGLVALMVNLTVAREKEPAAFSFADVRRILIGASDKERVEALGVLARSNQDNKLWSHLIRPFLTNAWPQQLKYQTEESSRQLALITENAGTHFPEAVALVLPHIRPVAHLNTFAYRLKQQGEEGIGYAADFPIETLQLLNALVGDDPQTAPWNLLELLEDIATSNPALRQSDPWRRLKAIAQ
ncbi:hypothetical protein [Komagataeibacter sp. NFXK3]